MRCRRRPAEVEAWQNARGTDQCPRPAWLADCAWGRTGEMVTVKTPMGNVAIQPGDWVVRDSGVICVCPADAFAIVFEEIKSPRSGTES